MHRFLYNRLRLAILIGLLALAGNSQAMTRNILVLGDSISAGYGMSLEQGWVALFERELAEKYPQYTVVNASISGETSGGGLRRLPELLEAHRPSLVIIELGGNDGLRGYPVSQLRDNLRRLAALASDKGAKVILVPVAIPPNYGRRYTSAFSESFALVASETSSTLAPLIFGGVATDPDLMQADGIHPTAEAQPLLLDNIRPTVLEVLKQL
ncbi:MAG: arylesterase [Haliea sp.]|jgi:acyl-CoA thioesterase-1|nr:arylesterase [Haliea sp.]